MEKPNFASDYLEGAHPAILERLAETNLLKTAGYGMDEFSQSAKEKIRAACKVPAAAVEFLVGGTQTNAIVIGALLRAYQGVLAANTGHISVHEAGAIECGGHKVLTVPNTLGKVRAADVRAYCEGYWHDANREHMVMPGMLYISQPTEYGTLYSLAELTALHDVCHEFNMLLYVDGARLAYALASAQNDVTLADLGRLCDAFYIGGTKCGALLGEAVVLPNPDLIPHFFSIIKQRGALLAKGRLLGIQFDTLFTDGLYAHIGETAIVAAQRLQEMLRTHGFTLAFDSPTNQVFVTLENDRLETFEKEIGCSYWEPADETHTIVRLATNWATTEADLQALEKVLDLFKEGRQ